MTSLGFDKMLGFLCLLRFSYRLASPGTFWICTEGMSEETQRMAWSPDRCLIERKLVHRMLLPGHEPACANSLVLVVASKI